MFPVGLDIGPKTCPSEVTVAVETPFNSHKVVLSKDSDKVAFTSIGPPPK